MSFKDTRAQYETAKALADKLETEMNYQKELAMRRVGKKIAQLLVEEALSFLDLEAIALNALRGDGRYTQDWSNDAALKEQVELYGTTVTNSIDEVVRQCILDHGSEEALLRLAAASINAPASKKTARQHAEDAARAAFEE